ncbi:unnamed protein product [Echinostoma caproni]|uniref:Uncharacterized protein n=1 Tax=Echinostoma caproni TaxID=27848 RepID=A0A3P8HGD9_9TREM|nr:unnamed protein product [Echinostoma caproni]
MRCCVVDHPSEKNGLHRVSSTNSDTFLTTFQRTTAAELKKAGHKGKKDQYAKTLVTMDPSTHSMLQFVTQGEIDPNELHLGEADTAVYEKLANMDELEPNWYCSLQLWLDYRVLEYHYHPHTLLQMYVPRQTWINRSLRLKYRYLYR